MLDAREAAERLGITERTLRNWVFAGRLSKITDERGRPRYREEEVARLVEDSSQPEKRDETEGAAPFPERPPSPELREISGSPVVPEALSLKKRLVVLRTVLREVRSDRDFLREELRRRHDELLHYTRELHLAKLETVELKGQLKAVEERAALPWWRRLLR